MASQLPPKAASISERRAASQRQQRSRPTSAVDPNANESRTDSKGSFHKKNTATTTETRRSTESRQTIIKRTISPVKRDDRNGHARKSTEVERPTAPVKDDAPGMLPVRARCPYIVAEIAD